VFSECLLFLPVSCIYFVLNSNYTLKCFRMYQATSMVYWLMNRRICLILNVGDLTLYEFLVRASHYVKDIM